MEAKLAETTSKRPLAVTIGAAVATLVIVAGVLTGPTLLNCANSADGFGVCLSGKLSDIGVLPKPAPVAVAGTGEPAGQQPAAETATPKSTAPAPVAETPAVIPDIIGPTFSLLRAQPDGSVVIAGSGKPGTEIEVFANDTPIGKTKVEASGDWVLVPDAPLADSGVELTVGEAGAKERSGQSFVVVIDPAHKAEPLVVASVPGKASEVLQGLAKPAEAAPVAVASAEVPAARPAASETSQASPPAPAPAAQAAPAAEATPPAAAATPAEPGAAGQEAPPAEVAASSELPAAAAPAAAEPATAETKVAAAEVPAAAPAASAVPAPTFAASIDAIEIDGDKNFFAGAGPNGATIRLYVDDAYIGDSVVRGGRWLVETSKNVLSKSEQLVRIDVLKPGTSEVASRAEVKFEVQLPGTPGTDVAVADAQKPAAETAAPAQEPAAATTTTAPPTASVSATTPAQQSTQAAAPADTTVVAEAPATEAGTAQAPGETAPAQPAAESIPRMVAVQVGNDPEAQRFASGKAIIRGGDNLWTIARRVYGKGIKYTTIYEANTGQIRDPHWIYPGQVFDLPEDKEP